jgi:AcrR family transcriptional regulator
MIISVTETLPRKRLTRNEIREQTRSRLLEAALQLFRKAGIEGFSVEDVSEMAGYSRGAFYSHFESKDDLVCAVLERENQRGYKQVDDLYAQNLSPIERLKQLRAYYINVARDLDGCAFWMSMHMYALRNPDVRPRIAELLRSDREAIVRYVRRTFEELGSEPPFPPDVLALTLIAEAQGLTLSRMVEPDAITAEQAEQALGGYFDRLVGM